MASSFSVIGTQQSTTLVESLGSFGSLDESSLAMKRSTMLLYVATVTLLEKETCFGGRDGMKGLGTFGSVGGGCGGLGGGRTPLGSGPVLQAEPDA